MAVKPLAKAPEPAVEKQTEAIKVAPVFGPMVHPHLNVDIKVATVFEAMDSWLECQIDAGKLKLV